ncbi:hypothetical protein J5U46_06065 [Micromonospora tulbaghiae]|uniref:Uncharacterized protein n=1 Tax=Micromonospora tulbaghiae TaxID=479978 RepID=A0AAW4JLJ8_9ACTN|nr:hypothetical protein [Micromonospora tulbaghiae]MBO4139709.1 hypothetical protein [Micromonospora tulbaghiae]
MKFREDADITTFDAIAMPIRAYNAFAGGHSQKHCVPVPAHPLIGHEQARIPGRWPEAPKVDAFGPPPGAAGVLSAVQHQNA